MDLALLYWVFLVDSVGKLSPLVEPVKLQLASTGSLQESWLFPLSLHICMPRYRVGFLGRNFLQGLDFCFLRGQRGGSRHHRAQRIIDAMLDSRLRSTNGLSVAVASGLRLHSYCIRQPAKIFIVPLIFFWIHLITSLFLARFGVSEVNRLVARFGCLRALWSQSWEQLTLRWAWSDNLTLNISLGFLNWSI